MPRRPRRRMSLWQECKLFRKQRRNGRAFGVYKHVQRNVFICLNSWVSILSLYSFTGCSSSLATWQEWRKSDAKASVISLSHAAACFSHETILAGLVGCGYLILSTLIFFSFLNSPISIFHLRTWKACRQWKTSQPDWLHFIMLQVKQCCLVAWLKNDCRIKAWKL